MSAAYLPGLAAHGAARLFTGDAKTDERDAMAIAKTALGIPDALLPVGDPGPTIAAARALTAQRNFLTCENTRNKNRLRSILLESWIGYTDVDSSGRGRKGRESALVLVIINYYHASKRYLSPSGIVHPCAVMFRRRVAGFGGKTAKTMTQPE